MYHSSKSHFISELRSLAASGRSRAGRLILGVQGPTVLTPTGAAVNFASDDYLGLAGHPDVIHASRTALLGSGVGRASSTFDTGSHPDHARLERQFASVLQTDAALLSASRTELHATFWSSLFGAEDAIIGDAGNAPLLRQGVRLSRARQFRYRHLDMGELEIALRAARSARQRVIVTESVFSDDGALAPLLDICELAARFDALVVLDDTLGLGVLGPRGGGAAALLGVSPSVDVVLSGFDAALGGVPGAVVAGPAELVALYREQVDGRGSAALPTSTVAAVATALEIAVGDEERRFRLHRNVDLLRSLLQAAAMETSPGTHPLIVLPVGESTAAVALAAELTRREVLTSALTYPRVPHGAARLLVRVTSEHTEEHLRLLAGAFLTTRALTA